MISKRGLCGPCGIAKSADQLRQLQDRSGPEYERWLDAHTAAIRRLNRARRRASAS